MHSTSFARALRLPSLALVTVALVFVGMAVAAPQLVGAESMDTDVYIRAARNLWARPDFLYTESYPIRPYTYPPFSALLFTSLLAVPLGWRTMALTAVSVACLYFVVHSLLRILATRLAPQRISLMPYAAVAVTLASLGLEPVFRNMVAGQVNLLVLPLTFYAIVGAKRGVGGALVGLAAGFKITPALFIVWFILHRRWRDVGSCAAAFLGTLAVGAVAAPSASWAYWTRVLFDDYRVGDPAFVYNQAMKGALLRWWGPDMPGGVWLGAVVVLAPVAAVALWRARHDALQGFSVIALAGVLVSPISWSHHWVILLPVLTAMSVLLCGRTLGGRGVHWWAGATLVGVWLVVLFTHVMWLGGSQNGLEFVQPFLVKVAQSSHTLLGVATLAWFATTNPREPAS